MRAFHRTFLLASGRSSPCIIADQLHVGNKPTLFAAAPAPALPGSPLPSILTAMGVGVGPTSPPAALAHPQLLTLPQPQQMLVMQLAREMNLDPMVVATVLHQQAGWNYETARNILLRSP